MSAVTNSRPVEGRFHTIEVLSKDVAIRVSELARRAFELFTLALYHTALVLVKVVFLPILFVSTAVIAIAYATCLVFDKALSKQALTSHLASLFDELPRVIRIAAKYGLSGAVLEKADDSEKSPHFVHIAPKAEQADLAPILVAPGYLDEPETMIDMCREIAEKSGRHVYIIKYYNRFESIPQLASDVERVALRIIKDRGDTRLIYGGHSMGGLTTGSHLIKSSGIDVKGWWTIGTPHYGTVMAYFGLLGKCGRQMQPKSQFLQKYTQDLSTLKETPQLHIYSDTDHVVLPGALPPHGEHYKCKDPVGHLGAREVEDVIDKIVDSMKAWDSA